MSMYIIYFYSILYVDSVVPETSPESSSKVNKKRKIGINRNWLFRVFNGHNSKTISKDEFTFLGARRYKKYSTEDLQKALKSMQNGMDVSEAYNAYGICFTGERKKKGNLVFQYCTVMYCVLYCVL